MSNSGPSDFTREVLGELVNDGFSIAAWRRFLSKSWQRSLNDMRESPALTRSFLWRAVGIAVIGILLLLVSWRYQSDAVAIKALSWWLPWYLLAVIFVLTHLGMSDDGGGRRVEYFHAANLLSFMRLALAPLVFLPVLAMPVVGPGAVFFAMFVAFLSMTDLLDGRFARHTGTCTRLGETLDFLGDLALLTFLSVGLYLAVQLGVTIKMTPVD